MNGHTSLAYILSRRKRQKNNVCSVTFSEGLIIDVTLYVANSYNGRHGWKEDVHKPLSPKWKIRTKGHYIIQRNL